MTRRLAVRPGLLVTGVLIALLGLVVWSSEDLFTRDLVPYEEVGSLPDGTVAVYGPEEPRSEGGLVPIDGPRIYQLVEQGPDEWAVVDIATGVVVRSILTAEEATAFIWDYGNTVWDHIVFGGTQAEVDLWIEENRAKHHLPTILIMAVAAAVVIVALLSPSQDRKQKAGHRRLTRT